VLPAHHVEPPPERYATRRAMQQFYPFTYPNL
jgi:hypothetical protein